MKTKCLLLVAALCGLVSAINSAVAQGTAFTYQGKLSAGGAPANGIYDLQFTVLDGTNTPGNVISGPVLNPATGVTNGLFTVTLDFGTGVFNGSARWLEIAVRTNGGSAFTTLSPRQPLTPAPYAILAGDVTSANIARLTYGTNYFSGVNTLNNPGNTFAGSFSGNGTGLTNVLGTMRWQTVAGTSAQALPNTGYLVNNAQMVTVTLPASPSPGDIVRVSGGGAGGWRVGQNAGQLVLTDSIIGVTSYKAVASSSDGTRLVAAQYQGAQRIYISTNSGAIWVPTSAPINDWSSVASSADGSKLVAAGGYPIAGPIYISPDTGVTWTATSAPIAAWTSVACSSDGSKLVAVVNSGIYTSTNSGASWTLTSAPSANWNSVASSSDGSKLVAVISGGLIYTSANSGATWTPASAPSGAWSSVASSSDGSKFVAVGDSSIYTPQASGQTATTSGAAGYLAGGQSAAIELQYIGNGQFRPLSFLGTITGY